MGELYTLTPISSLVSAIIATAMILMSIYSTIVSGTTLTRRSIIYSVFFLVLDLIIFLAVIDSCSALAGYGEIRSVTGDWFARLQPHFRMLALSCMLVLAMLRLNRVDTINHSDITQFSVGEAMEKMPVGILFYGQNGIVLQANGTMDNLCYEITGRVLINGNSFWEEINQGKIKDDMELTPGEDPIVTKPDGSSWMFKKMGMDTPLGFVNQIYGINVTAEQSLVRELEEDNIKLREMNQRLRRYNSMVDETIRREELLATKIRVHDEMGEELISARMLIENKDAPITADAVYNKWNQNLRLLMQEAKLDEVEAGAKASDMDRSQVEAQTQRLMNAAEHLGIELQMAGTMPEDFDIMQLICVGIQECMTNAIQHADASQMYVSIEEGDNEFTVNFSNNGKPMEGPVKEGGGLSLLRQSAEKYGARIEYAEGPRFNMTLNIPKA